MPQPNSTPPLPTESAGHFLAILLTGTVLSTVPLAGQTVQFAGTQSTVGSGLNTPYGVAVDAAGDVFIADLGNNRVLKVAPNGTQSTVGSGLNHPWGVAVDASGDVFIVDTGNSRVLKVAPNGTQSIVASGLSYPYGVAVGAAGDVFYRGSRQQPRAESRPQRHAIHRGQRLE